MKKEQDAGGLGAAWSGWVILSLLNKKDIKESIYEHRLIQDHRNPWVRRP